MHRARAARPRGSAQGEQGIQGNAGIDGVLNTALSAATFVDSTGGQNVTSTTAVSLNVWTPVITHSGFTHSAGVTTVVADGLYQIETNLSVTGTTGNYRWTGQVEFYKNSTTILSKNRGGYVRASSGSNNTYLGLTSVVNWLLEIL